jgi:hypothetical protein
MTAHKLLRPGTLHHLLNPAIVFNELALGQRVPLRSLVCRLCEGSEWYRTYVPCPHCGALHEAFLWLGKNAFGNWLGLVCPSCGGRIPCVWNVVSLALLLVTFPIWYVPYRFYFRGRAARKPVTGPGAGLSSRTRLFVVSSTLFALAMWLAMVAFPVFYLFFTSGRMEFTRLVLGTGVCLCVGLAFGGLMLIFVPEEEWGETGKGTNPDRSKSRSEER